MKLHKDQLLQWHTIFNNNRGSFITTVKNFKLNNHPLIIFYNEYNKKVYYLKGQTFDNQWFYNENEPYFYKIKSNNSKEVFQPTPQLNKHFVYDDTLFDTSTIYEMELENFITFFDLNEEYSYSKINPEDQRNILKNLYFNFENDDIAHEVVNATLKKVKNKERIISTSYYSYVSEDYLKRNFGYEGRDVTSFDLESLMNKFNLDVREEPLSYNTIDEIISNAIYDFEIKYPEFRNDDLESVPLTPESNNSRSR